jgi:hypothetical protein
MEDLPPSSPPTSSRKMMPEQSPKPRRIKKSNRPPQRLRSDSLPATDDLFLPGCDYNDATVINDREPSPPDLPPASYTNGKTAIVKSNTGEPTTASTDFETPTSEMVAGWAAL